MSFFIHRELMIDIVTYTYNMHTQALSQNNTLFGTFFKLLVILIILTLMVKILFLLVS